MATTSGRQARCARSHGRAGRDSGMAVPGDMGGPLGEVAPEAGSRTTARGDALARDRCRRRPRRAASPAAVWSCWSILGATAPRPGGEAEAVDVAAAGAGPGQRPSTTRSRCPQPEPGQGRRGDRGRPPSRRRRKGAAAGARRSGEARSRPAAEARRPRPEPRPAADGDLGPRRPRVAMIGGRAYVEGETIDGTDPGDRPGRPGRDPAPRGDRPLLGSGRSPCGSPRRRRRDRPRAGRAPAGRRRPTPASSGRGPARRRVGHDPGEDAMMKTAEAGDHALILRVLQARGLLDPAKAEAFRDAQGRDDDVPERLARPRRDRHRPSRSPPPTPTTSRCPSSSPARGDRPDSELARLLPEKLCRDQLIVPVASTGETLDLAFATPSALLVVDEVQLLTGLHVRPLVAPLSVVEAWLDRSSARAPRPPSSAARPRNSSRSRTRTTTAATPTTRSSTSTSPRPPAATAGSSGWSTRSSSRPSAPGPATSTSSRSRTPARSASGSTASSRRSPRRRGPSSSRSSRRFKILAKMDIAEKRVPQDGAIAMRSGERRVDLRVNTVPTVFGEKMVMRLLDKAAIPLHLTGLGLDERQSTDLIESIQMPHGLMLVTGPTGSGKSTTLYSCLNLLNDPKTNICTVEDPVEYKFKGMNQVQVKAAGRPDLRLGPAGVPPAGPRRHHGRRGPRPGDGADLPPGRPDGPLRPLDDPHQRLALGGQPAHGHGDRAVPAGLDPPRPRGAAARPAALQGLQGAVPLRPRERRALRPGARARRSTGPRVATPAGGPATGAGSASSR